MAQLNYIAIPVTIHVIYNPDAGIPANTNRHIYVRSGQDFDHAIQDTRLRGKTVSGWWWTVPTYRSGFRDTFSFLRVEKPIDDDVQVRGTTVGGANGDVDIVIHVIYPT